MSGKDVHVTVLCPNFVRTRINDSQRNMPEELRRNRDDPMTKMVKKIADDLVNAGIEADEVAAAVEDAIVQNKFWILTNEHSATRITEQRLEWMRGGRPPRAKKLAAPEN